jgi:outer membrane immunogenic protein
MEGTMRKVLLTAVAVSCLGAAPALAADRPIYKAPPVYAPIFNWTGFYIGADAGYLWSSVDAFVPFIPGLGTATPDPSGFSFGGHIGYRYQFPNGFVVGVEGDIGWLDASATGAFPGFPVVGAFANLRWDASARGTLGWAMDRILIYVTGGASWLNGNGCFVAMVAPTTCAPGTNISATFDGWVFGGGVAYAFTDNLIFRFEYLHADYGTTAFPAAGTNLSPTTDKVRAGLSWKFGSY